MFHDPKTLFFRLMQRLTTLKDKKKSKVGRQCMNITTFENSLGNINHFKLIDLFRNKMRNASNRFTDIQQDSL